MKPVNIIYFGSPEFSAQILESLLAGSHPELRVVGVVTNPDKPVGRKQILTPSPVAQVAESYHLPTFKPTKLDDQNLLHLKLLKPDLFIIAAYGKIIPQSWLDLPTIAPLNLHFSLLPKYRGALCIQEAIKNEDKETGVTLMEVDAEMDHGPIIAQITETIDINDNVATLTQKLTKKAIKLLHEALPPYLSFRSLSRNPSEIRLTNHSLINLFLPPQPQEHSRATLTPSYRNLTRNSAFIPWEDLKKAMDGNKASKIHALIRSLTPDPGAWTITEISDQQTANRKKIEFKLIKTSLEKLSSGLLILKPEIVQTPGKKEISYKQFLQGHSKII